MERKRKGSRTPPPGSMRDPPISRSGPRRTELPPAKVQGAICLPAPGRSCGPCSEPCEHLRCGIAREVAERRCQICGEGNGYEVAIYAYATRCGHADCIDESRQRATKRFIDALVDLLVKDVMQRVKDGTFKGDVAPDESSCLMQDRTEDQPTSTRYMLPEFDIDVAIPAAGRRGGSYRATAAFGVTAREHKKRG